MALSGHDDPASAVSYVTARRLLEESTARGRRLLELFARHQVLPLPRLQEEFGTNQNALNALLGALTLRFHEIQGEPGFYIYIPKMKAWAIGNTSRLNLRRAIRELERSRQRELRFGEGSEPET